MEIFSKYFGILSNNDSEVFPKLRIPHKTPLRNRVLAKNSELVFPLVVWSLSFLNLLPTKSQESHIRSFMNVLHYCNLDESLHGEDTLLCENAFDRLFRTKDD